MTHDKEHNHVNFEQMLQAAEAMKAFQAATPQSSLKGELGDVVVKVLVAVCTAAVLWTANSVNNNTQTIGAMQVEARVWRAGIDEDISKLKEFAEVPRFTDAQDTAKLAPISQMVTRHDAELNERGIWIRQVDSKITSIENRYEVILDKLSEVNTQLKLLTEKQYERDRQRINNRDK